MHGSDDARRRWLGLFFLTVSAGMLLCGQTFLQPHLEGFLFLVYWLSCLGFTCVTLVIALLDVRAVRRRILEEHRQEQAALLRRTLADLEHGHSRPPAGPRPPLGEAPDSDRQST